MVFRTLSIVTIPIVWIKDRREDHFRDDRKNFSKKDTIDFFQLTILYHFLSKFYNVYISQRQLNFINKCFKWQFLKLS